jgi:hypothetical protein
MGVLTGRFLALGDTVSPLVYSNVDDSYTAYGESSFSVVRVDAK